MQNELMEQLALKTGGSHFPAVFGHYQKDYIDRKSTRLNSSHT